MPLTLAVQRSIAISGLLIFGTGSTVVSKFLYEQKSVGLISPEPRNFNKPWFMTLIMFIGMALSLVSYAIEYFFFSRKFETNEAVKSDASEHDNVEGETMHVKKKPTWKTYLALGAPSCFDLVGSTMLNVGLMYIQASVFQMLKGMMVIYTLIISSFILKRPHYPFMWFSAVIVVIAIAIVGVSAVISTGVSVVGVTQGQVVLAIFLCIGAQILQAAQIMVEDYLLHDVTAPPTLIVGMEGVWGIVLTAFVFLPITMYLPGTDGNGIHENTLDTFEMMKNNKLILGFVIFRMIVAFIFNVTSTMVTSTTTGVMRTILEGVRTLVTWIVSLIMFYSLMKTDYGKEHPNIGESWTPYSWIQLAGFAILFLGMLMYNQVIKIPCIFRYPEEEGEAKGAEEKDAEAEVDAEL